jgi:signal transduction histidine kinase
MKNDAPTGKRSGSTRTAVMVGLAYFVVGSLWILLSDALVESVSTDPSWLNAAQRYKGLAYIFVTTWGLVYLVRRSYRRLLAAEWRARDEAQEELKTRLEALVAERTRELAQTNIELEAFSRTAAHDLKAPLNGIVGLSQLLRTRYDGALDETGMRYVELIERSARDMSHLINDLLRLSRAGSVELQRDTVDLLPLVRALVQELRESEPLRQVQVELPGTIEVYCDPGLMRSLLQNLVGNAWKFTAQREDARVAVSQLQTAEATQIRVADNGTGFDTSTLTGLFRPFQRFHSQAQFQGTGLGLVTCQRIAHRHGGQIEVESTPGQGTTVTVTLPTRPDRTRSEHSARQR